MAKSKKNKQYKKYENTNTSTSSEIVTLVKIIVVGAIFFGIMYLFTVLILNKNQKDAVSSIGKTEAVIQYDEILAGESFNKKDANYIVVYYDMSAANKTTYSNLIAQYQQNNEDKAIYYVDLSNAFNQKFVSDSSNPEVQDIDGLKLNGATLIEFVDNKVDSYIEGEEAITNYLK